MIKSDCFAFQSYGKRVSCTALDDVYCKYGKCSFYKTKAQDAADRAKYGGIAPAKNKSCGRPAEAVQVDGKYIGTLLEIKKMSGIELAKRCGVSKETVYRAIKHNRASGKFISAAAKVLDVPKDVLMR